MLSNRFRYLVSKSKSIVLVSHRKPDGDTVGSMLGLALALTGEGKNVSTFSSDPLTAQLTILPSAHRVKNTADFVAGDYDLVIALDCGDYSQMGLSVEQDRLPLIINIDHHGTECFGDLNIVDTKASSTAEIVHVLLKKLHIPISKNIATCFLAGIMQDTDNFKNPNTTTQTLETTSYLLSRGANFKKLGRHFNHSKSLSSLKLWGKILARMRRHPQLNVVSTFITNQEIVESNSSSEDIEGVANFLNSIPDVKASCVLTEIEKDEIKGSLRTLDESVDVSKIASFFGGGGHKKAAGFRLKGRIVMYNNAWHVKSTKLA